MEYNNGKLFNKILKSNGPAQNMWTKNIIELLLGKTKYIRDRPDAEPTLQVTLGKDQRKDVL